MQWSYLLLALVSIGLVAGDGAWKENYEYKYELVAKKVFKQDLETQVATFRVTIRPQSDSLFIGNITAVSYCNYPDGQDSDCDSDDMLLNKLFKVYLRNGVIDTVSVDQTMTKDQIKVVKSILSQFQIDVKARNSIRETDNHTRRDQSDNDFYTTMEPTVVGVCKTTYDISRHPEYLVMAKYDTISTLSQYAGEEEVIEIAKTMDLKECGKEKTELAADFDDQDQNKGLYNTRVVISGSRDKYTIHKSVGAIRNENLDKFTYLTLLSMERINGGSYQARSNYNYNPRFGNMKNVGTLVYNMDERY